MLTLSNNVLIYKLMTIKSYITIHSHLYNNSLLPIE